MTKEFRRKIRPICFTFRRCPFYWFSFVFPRSREVKITSSSRFSPCLSVRESLALPSSLHCHLQYHVASLSLLLLSSSITYNTSRDDASWRECSAPHQNLDSFRFLSFLILCMQRCRTKSIGREKSRGIANPAGLEKHARSSRVIRWQREKVTLDTRRRDKFTVAS